MERITPEQAREEGRIIRNFQKKIEQLEAENEKLREDRDLLKQSEETCDKYRELLKEVMSQPYVDRGFDYTWYTTDMDKDLIYRIEKALQEEKDGNKKVYV